MGETVWYRIVGKGRTVREEVLPSRSGRFHEDPETEPASYAGDSLLTVWRESLSARAGMTRVNPGAFRAWRIRMRGVTMVDLRKAVERKRLGITQAELAAIPASPKCREVARALRSWRTEIHGILYGSVQNPPNGICAAFFLERAQSALSLARVPEEKWKEFLKTVIKEIP